MTYNDTNIVNRFPYTPVISSDSVQTIKTRHLAIFCTKRGHIVFYLVILHDITAVLNISLLCVAYIRLKDTVKWPGLN